jgi:hypothetical protein
MRCYSEKENDKHALKVLESSHKKNIREKNTEKETAND